MDNSKHKKIDNLKKLARFISIIMLMISLFITLMLVYIGFQEPRDGDFCDLVQTRYDYDYDFLISEGVGCKFLFSGLKEPAVVFIFINIIFQTPLFFMYHLIKKDYKK